MRGEQNAREENIPLIKEAVVKPIVSITTAIAALPVWRSASSTMWRESREKEESERKRVEAEYISDFQTNAAADIEAQLHRWKGIETTQRIVWPQNITLFTEEHP